MRPGACEHCGSTRRWRRVDNPNRIGCWRCWRCGRPPFGAWVDALNLVHGQPRILLDVPAASLDDDTITVVMAACGAPIALRLDPLPCRCRACRAEVTHCAPPPHDAAEGLRELEEKEARR